MIDLIGLVEEIFLKVEDVGGLLFSIVLGRCGTLAARLDVGYGVDVTLAFLCLIIILSSLAIHVR